MRRAGFPSSILAAGIALWPGGAVLGVCRSAPPSPTPTPDVTSGGTPAPGGAPAPAAAGTPTPTPIAAERTLRPCRAGSWPAPDVLVATRQVLYETLCNAAIWLDAWPHKLGTLESPQDLTGRVTLSVQHSELEGTKVPIGFDVNIRFQPDSRFHLFFERSDLNDSVRARQEAFGLASQFDNLESQEKWLGGLGYSLPGTDNGRLRFRLGVGGRALFAQAVYNSTYLVDGRNLWHLSQVAFWRTHVGFGFTSSADYDHIINERVLLRWANIGTVAEDTRGLDWRSALVLYRNLGHAHALAYELFIRGLTSTLGLAEYGGRVVYRRSAFRDWFFVEALSGYSFLRLEPGVPRRGSVVVGLGCELGFGPPA